MVLLGQPPQGERRLQLQRPRAGGGGKGQQQRGEPPRLARQQPLCQQGAGRLGRKGGRQAAQARRCHGRLLGAQLPWVEPRQAGLHSLRWQR